MGFSSVIIYIILAILGLCPILAMVFFTRVVLRGFGRHGDEKKVFLISLLLSGWGIALFMGNLLALTSAARLSILPLGIPKSFFMAQPMLLFILGGGAAIVSGLVIVFQNSRMK